MNSIRLIILNHLKPGHAVNFTNHLASVVSLIFLLKTLIEIKSLLPSNSLKLAELMVNELKKTFSENIYQYSFVYPIYHYFAKVLSGYS